MRCLGKRLVYIKCSVIVNYYNFQATTDILYNGKETQALESDHLCLCPGSTKYYLQWAKC